MRPFDRRADALRKGYGLVRIFDRSDICETTQLDRRETLVQHNAELGGHGPCRNHASIQDSRDLSDGRIVLRQPPELVFLGCRPNPVIGSQRSFTGARAIAQRHFRPLRFDRRPRSYGRGRHVDASLIR
jgi:hypothetical protein